MSASSSRRDAIRSVAAHFSREAREYAEASESGLWRWWRRREQGAIWRRLMPRRGELILDAGSGAGHYSALLWREGAEVVATDLSPAMARQVKRRLRVPVFVSNLEAVALRPVFDAVVCAGALEFCPHPLRAFRCLAPCLKDGRSRLVVMLPAEGLAGRLYAAFHLRHGLSINLFSRRRISQLARASGLVVTHLDRVGFNYVVRLQKKGSP